MTYIEQERIQPLYKVTQKYYKINKSHVSGEQYFFANMPVNSLGLKWKTLREQFS